MRKTKAATRQKGRGTPKNGKNGERYQVLLALVKENPLRLFNVGDIQRIFRIPPATMTELRQLAARDPATDPWLGDLTSPQEFSQWFWHTRRGLVEKFPGASKPE